MHHPYRKCTACWCCYKCLSVGQGIARSNAVCCFKFVKVALGCSTTDSTEWHALLCVQIEFLDGRWHNLPSAPGLICRFNGFLMGRVMRWAEPLWSRGLWLVGDHSYSNQSSSSNLKDY
jgi:hypothetical protein